MTIDAKNDTKKPVVHRPERKQYNIDKKYPRKNIALKCNYNDGGRNNSRIGYCGVCSDPVIRHNIVDKKRSWCSNPDCSCKQYIDRKISRRELDSQCENGGWVCYESQMLREWRAWAGQSISRGTVTENMRFQSVRRNSLAILTTRKPKSKEADRFIFAVFLVDDFWEGDEKEEGCVSSNSIYRLAFSEKECRELLFWNYYSNKTRTEKPLWGSGLHRYVSDDLAVQILRDAVKVKWGTEDQSLAEDFLSHYCALHSISPEDIGEPRGALKI